MYEYKRGQWNYIIYKSYDITHTKIKKSGITWSFKKILDNDSSLYLSCKNVMKWCNNTTKYRIRVLSSKSSNIFFKWYKSQTSFVFFKWNDSNSAIDTAYTIKAFAFVKIPWNCSAVCIVWPMFVAGFNLRYFFLIPALFCYSIWLLFCFNATTNSILHFWTKL